jgi:L-threonate 2-dehydrogenase
MNERSIGILSPGEMGSQVGLVLHEAGAEVHTLVQGRSAATAERAAAAGMTAAADLDTLVRSSALILTVLPPSAAEPVAGEVAAALTRTGARPLYCDLNSIGPSTARRIQQTVQDAGARFVDGCIIGSGGGLRSGRTTFYLAGDGAAEVAALIRPLATITLDGGAGEASAFKVFYAGMTKGMSALGMELLAGAERFGLRERLMDRYRSDHPSVASFFESNLPGLPPRSERRAEEMTELAETLEELGLDSFMAAATQRTLASVADRHAEDGAAELSNLDELLRWWAK